MDSSRLVVRLHVTCSNSLPPCVTMRAVLELPAVPAPNPGPYLALMLSETITAAAACSTASKHSTLAVTLSSTSLHPAPPSKQWLSARCCWQPVTVTTQPLSTQRTKKAGQHSSLHNCSSTHSGAASTLAMLLVAPNRARARTVSHAGGTLTRTAAAVTQPKQRLSGRNRCCC